MAWFISTILFLAIAAIATTSENDGSASGPTTIDFSENNADLMKNIEEDVKLELSKPQTTLKPGQFINKLAKNIGKEVKKILPQTNPKATDANVKRAFSFFDFILKSLGINMDAQRKNSAAAKPSDTKAASGQAETGQQDHKDSSATNLNDEDSEADPFFSFISGLSE